ncbi:MAG: hypothetical protein ACD_49C00084G0006 [uncultured bacterium (gcode 4)]|uniref:Uncharacterized protein n=1 Tax=uncultured bacterium (gcode 4) TaxID=1234023 RepID=K2AVW4_9BACT|nr:MAG: hypothetical protein ACD_49C00084G0006 [uncultured bacterium (gcode 4)]
MGDWLQINTGTERLEEVYFNDKMHFLSAIRKKIDEAHIHLDTKNLLENHLIKVENKRKLDWLIEWTQKEQWQFTDKLNKVKEEKTSIFNKLNKVDDLISEEINREEIETFLRSVKEIEIEKVDEKERIRKFNELSSQVKELGIIVYETNTVGEAIHKTEKTGYNCVFLLDKDNKLIWIFTKNQLQELDSNKKISEIVKDGTLEFWKKDITNNDAKNKMMKLWINALPILDEQGILYWVLSIKDLEKNIAENKCVLSLTELNLDFLKQEI